MRVDERYIGEMDTPPDIPLKQARKADTSKRVVPGQTAATQEYVDERFAALSTLIQTSVEPAMALMPSSKKKEIQAALNEFNGLIEGPS